MCCASLRHGTTIETNGIAVGMSGDPGGELAEPLHPFAHRRPGVVPVPRLDAGTGGLRAEQLPHRLRTAWVRGRVTRRPAAEDMEEALHVALSHRTTTPSR